MRAWRVALATAGLALGGFGLFRLVTEVPLANLVVLGGWLVAAVAIHDGLLAPAVVGVGWVLGRGVAPRGRRYLQGALIAGGLITVVAVPMMLRAGSEPASKALLQQDFGVNLTILLGAVAAASLLLYAVRLAREGRAPSSDQPDPAAPPES